MGDVTIAIPTLNGAGVVEQTLAAAHAQQLPEGTSLELLVCDSGSRDGTVELARSLGAEVIEIPPGTFSHGGTRNLLMERSSGDHVAFLTQDAVPADGHWLGRLLEGFKLSEDVALVYGPYRPRPEASPMVARELTEWFRSFSPAGEPRVDRLREPERSIPARALLGPRSFFTDANGCLAREAWHAVPFRRMSYAEDHMLALDMLRAGYAKVFQPEAAVIHSHEYSLTGWLRRAFDEARGLHDVYDYAPPSDPRAIAKRIWGLVGADWRWAARGGERRSAALLWQSTTHHLVRALGSALGARADRLPRRMARTLSLEGRDR